MNEKRSYTENLVVGSPQTQFAIGFKDYQAKKDMLKVTVDNKDITEAGYTVTRNVGNVLKFNPAVPVDSIVRIQRVTDIDAPFYIFTAGNSFVPSNVDANFKQLLHSQQEVKDRQDHLEDRVIPVVDGLEEALEAVDAAVKEAQEAKEAAEEAAQTTRSASNVIDASGLTQQQVNDKSITSVDSIADLIAITNPKDGRRVFVNGLQGDYFVYYASKVSVNDGIFIFNGWVRQQNKYKINARYAGLTGDINQDAAPLIHKIFIYLYIMRNENNNNTFVELYFPTGIYKPQTLIKAGSGTEHFPMIYMFPNMKVYGDGDSSVLMMPDNVMSMLPELGRFSFFWLEILCENTVVRDLKVDFNSATNYYATFVPNPRFSKGFNGYIASWQHAHRNNKIRNVTWFECASYNVINCIDWNLATSDWEVSNCRFINCGDKAHPLNKIKDHSTIFMAGKDKRIFGNKFSTKEGSLISAGIELHNDGEVHDNTFDNYALPFHVVAEEDSIHQAGTSTGGSVSNWRNNTATNALYGLSHNFRDAGNTSATFSDNYIHLRGQKSSSTAAGGLLYLHSAYESGGGINEASLTNKHKPRIYLKGNTFEQDANLQDWTASDMQINHCMNVKNVWLFEATDNTFIGFKGSVLQVLQQNGANIGSNKTRIILKGNTYIDCGFDMFNGYNTVAYKIQGDGYTNTTLGSLYTENETFIDCKYDYMLGTAKSGIVMNKVVIDAEIKSGLFITPYFDAAGVTGNTFSNYSIKYKCASRDNLAMPSALLLSDRYGLEYVVKVDNINSGSAEFRNLTIHKNVQQNTHFIDVVGSQAPSQLDSSFTMYPATVGSKATIENPLQGSSLLYSWLYADVRSRYEWVGTAPITVA